MSEPRQAQSPKERRRRGFTRAAQLAAPRIRAAGEGRGFAVARLLTHWEEVAGPELAAMARPLELRYGREGFGATLSLATTGAFAPLVEMGREALRARVNACYGYAAVSRIRLVQVAPEVLARPLGPATPKAPAPELVARATGLAGNVQDTDLRAALADLGANILSRREKNGENR
jgi:Uncharacterized protein conserved in bacteria